MLPVRGGYKRRSENETIIAGIMIRVRAIPCTLWGLLTIAALWLSPLTSRADDPLPSNGGSGTAGTVGTVGVWRRWNPPQQLNDGLLLTVLSDRRVLLAGGEPPRVGATATADVLNPRSGAWSATDPPAMNRVEHAAVALPSGGALLVGGIDRSKSEPMRHRNSHSYEPPKLSAALLASAEVWDPARGWHKTGSLLEARAQPQAALLQDGRVLITGGIQHTYGPDYVTPTILKNGRSRALASAEIWSPRAGRWQAAAPMAQARYSHTATALEDGRVLVVGGAPAVMTRAALNVPAETWDPETGRWTPTARPRYDRMGHTATRLRDGRVLIVGGHVPAPAAGGADPGLSAAEAWDPHTGRWIDVAPMAFARANHDAVLLPDGRVLVAGGGGPTAEVWDPVADRWTATGPFTDQPDYGVRLAPLPDGTVLLVGMTVQLWSPH